MEVAEAAKEALWLAGLVKELGMQQGGVQLHCDNQSVIFLAKNQVYHARSKHIDVRFHKIRELVSFGELFLEKIHIFENTIDILIKHVIILRLEGLGKFLSEAKLLWGKRGGGGC